MHTRAFGLVALRKYWCACLVNILGGAPSYQKSNVVDSGFRWRRGLVPCLNREICQKYARLSRTSVIQVGELLALTLAIFLSHQVEPF